VQSELPQKLIMIHVTAFEALNDHAADRLDSYYKLLPDGQQRTRRSRTQLTVSIGKPPVYQFTRLSKPHKARYNATRSRRNGWVCLAYPQCGVNARMCPRKAFHAFPVIAGSSVSRFNCFELCFKTEPSSTS